MTTKQWLIAAAAVIAALGISFSAGRYSAPAKIVERIVEKEKIVEVIDQKAITEAVTKAQIEWKKNEKTHVVVRTIYKEGQIVEKIVYRDRDVNSSGGSTTTSNTSSTTSTTATTVTEKVVYRDRMVESKKDRWRLGVSASVDWQNPQLQPPSMLVYEARGEVRIIGGLWGGITVTPQHNLVGAVLSFQF